MGSCANQTLNDKALVGDFNQEKAKVQGLLRDCEIFAKLGLQLYKPRYATLSGSIIQRARETECLILISPPAEVGDPRRSGAGCWQSCDIPLHPGPGPAVTGSPVSVSEA